MTEFEEIRSANEQIRTTNIKGKEYAEVNQRVKAFRMVHPNGAILTEIIDLSDGIVTMKASALDEEGKILGTGHAQEKESSSYINKTSYIENCETSAVGRALGMCGFGIDTSICSADELTNAMNNQGEGADDDPLGELHCSVCGADIAMGPYKATMKQFGKALCPSCIKKEFANRGE